MYYDVEEVLRIHFRDIRFDHWGTTTFADRKAFVSEPYHVDSKMLVACEELAKILDCHFQVFSNSWHYPGHTFRLIWVEK